MCVYLHSFRAQQSVRIQKKKFHRIILYYYKHNKPSFDRLLDCLFSLLKSRKKFFEENVYQLQYVVLDIATISFLFVMLRLDRYNFIRNVCHSFRRLDGNG